MIANPSPLVQQVLTGANPELRRLAAQGLLPLPPEELIPIAVTFAEGGEPELAELAAATLGSLEPRLASHYLGEQAGPEVLAYFVAHVRQPLILETLLRRRDLPRPFFLALAPELPEDLQEILLLRQDVIVEEPAVLDALEKNPRLSGFARRRILEYRKHLLPQGDHWNRRRVQEETEEEEPSEEEVEAAVEVARTQPELGERDTSTGLTEGQIRTMAVPVRIKLTRGASRTLRGILLRDPNPQVAVGVLKGAVLSDQEVEQICHNRSICEEVLEEITRHREWMNKYPIANALVHNPRTPLPASLKLMPKLAVRDLRELSKNRNVPDAVRALAERLYKIKRR